MGKPQRSQPNLYEMRERTTRFHEINKYGIQRYPILLKRLKSRKELRYS